MRVGTKSILFGAHCFFLHPWFVFWAWWNLYGFPFDPRLWLSFFLHDLGYFGKPNMDGAEGERHPEWAAKAMGCLFGDSWHDFCKYHSRFLCKSDGTSYSLLCVADKLSISLTPAWLYLPMVRASGELGEYMALAKARTDVIEPKYASMGTATDTAIRWYSDVQVYCRNWAHEHRDGRADTWTPDR